MRLARKASLIPSDAFRRLIFTSPMRLKLPKHLRTKSMLDALIVPAVPKIKPGSFSAKLQQRLDSLKIPTRIARRKRTAPPNSECIAQQEAVTDVHDDVEGMEGMVTGWGHDKLAPPPTDHEKPSHDLKVDLRTVRQFELEAYYRHGRDPPRFERRIHLWITGESDEPALERIEPLGPQPPLTQLSHSLERVLFNTGPHWLKDPRTRVYNFDQWLENIPDIHDFDYGRLTPYVTSSQDDNLFNLAKRERKIFAGSTSSLTSLLSHIYFVISGGRGVDISVLSSAFADEPREFSYGARWPGGITLRHKDGLYCVDSHEIEDPEKHLLLNMGTMLEKFLTRSQEDFNLLRRNAPITGDLTQLQRPESYQYSKSDKFVMRAQLDAQDPRLPGSGVFDIKTRAAVAIRYDPLNYKKNAGYLIKTTQGAFESFEREHYDLIRAAFLKYVFQVRIGNMDGIFVAYHNTAYMFGFQYFSREDMDDRLFGGPVQGDRVFQKCVKCMEEILSEVILCFPGISVNCAFETSPQENALRIYIEPAEWNAPGETPVVELLVTATNYLNGERVLGPMNFGAHDDDWSILLNITRSSSTSEGLNSSIKKQMDALIERKNEFMFWIPQGVTPAQMAEQWLRTDYTSAARLEGPDPEMTGAASKSAVYDADELALLARRFKERSRPTEFVISLRELAKEGRNYLAELEAAVANERDPKQDAESSARSNPKGLTGVVEDMNLQPPHIEGFSHDMNASSLDNSPCSSPLHKELSSSGSEEGPIEQGEIDVPIEGTSVRVNSVEGQLTSKGETDEIQILSKIGFGESLVKNDNPAPLSVEGAGEIDQTEGPAVLGSEEDQLEMLDPTNEANTRTSDQPSEQSSGDEVELDSEDQAWSSHSISSTNDSQSSKGEPPDRVKGPVF